MREPASDSERFGMGDCHVLAEEIHRRTGWPLHAFELAGQPVLHAFVLTPRHTALDCRGERPLAELYAQYGRARHRSFSVAQMVAHWGGARYGVGSYPAARRLADQLLAAA